jgi:dihydropteroate synthase
MEGERAKGTEKESDPGKEKGSDPICRHGLEGASHKSGLTRFSSRQIGSDPFFKPLVMGILNVTPDSFSDGGDYWGSRAAVEQAIRAIDGGADVIDVGPESTRPGGEPVKAEEQIRRAVPVIERIAEARPAVPISIDTRLSSVAAAALEAGASMVNDVTAGRDDRALLPLAAERGASVVLMHMQGRPADMQRDPSYADVVAEVLAFLKDRAAAALAAGVPRERIIIDPGIGFGKTAEHNLSIMRRLEAFVATGYAVLVGASRKSFLGTVAGEPVPKKRLAGSLACVVRAATAGVHMVRVHDVSETRQLLLTLEAITEQKRGQATFS